MADNNKIIRFRNYNFNIGVIIFLIIIIYVIFNIFSYITSSPIAEYEVSQGTIATNHVYRGLILRDETVEYADTSGYINYFVKNGSKVSVHDVIYSIDKTGALSEKIQTATEDGTALEESSLEELFTQIGGFENSYNSNHFSTVYSFKQQLQSELSQTLSTKALITLTEQVNFAKANKTFYQVTSPKTGIVVYAVDGYEDIKPSNFTADNFAATSYSKKSLDVNHEISEGDPTYKRINSEDWNIIIAISESLAKELEESGNRYIKIRFCKDDFTVNAQFDIVKKSGSYYLNLQLRTAMIRYVNDRFEDIELVLNEQIGLKIPNSAITSKEFFTVPKEYFTSSSDSNDLSLMLKSSGHGEDVTLVTPIIYYESENAYYIDSEFVSSGDIIVKSDSVSTYKIGKDVDSLVGVYNINKGYAVFKQISILSQNDDYTIVETKTAYGLSLYDHIALDGSKVVENQMIAK